MHHHREAAKKGKKRISDFVVIFFFFAKKSFSLCHVLLGKVLHHDFSEVFLLFAIRQGLNGSEAIDYVSGFAEIDLV